MISWLKAMVIGAAVGWLADKLNISRNGLVASVLLGLGGAVAMRLVTAILGIGFGGAFLNAAIGAAAALMLARLQQR